MRLGAIRRIAFLLHRQHNTLSSSPFYSRVLKVPADIAIVGSADLGAAAEAVALLLDKLTVPAEEHTLPVQLIVRESSHDD
jgi:hypothetical protein